MMLRVSFFIVPILLVCFGHLAGAFLHDQLLEYLLCLLFEYRLRSLIVCQTLWKYHIEQIIITTIIAINIIVCVITTIYVIIIVIVIKIVIIVAIISLYHCYYYRFQMSILL